MKLQVQDEVSQRRFPKTFLLGLETWPSYCPVPVWVFPVLVCVLISSLKNSIPVAFLKKNLIPSLKVLFPEHRLSEGLELAS